jgi:hypothetical protein
VRIFSLFSLTNARSLHFVVDLFHCRTKHRRQTNPGGRPNCCSFDEGEALYPKPHRQVLKKNLLLHLLQHLAITAAFHSFIS